MKEKIKLFIGKKEYTLIEEIELFRLFNGSKKENFSNHINHTGLRNNKDVTTYEKNMVANIEKIKNFVECLKGEKNE